MAEPANLEVAMARGRDRLAGKRATHVQEATMSSIRKSTKDVMTRSHDAAVRVGKVAKSAAVAGAKAGAAAAIAAGAVEAEKSWKETSPEAAKQRTRNGVGVVLAGAAVLGAVGAVIVSSRRNKKT